MPNRNLKEVINSSRRLSRVSLLAAYLFDRLITVVDDFGLFEAEKDIVKFKTMPLRGDVTAEQIDTALLELDAVGVIRLYHDQQGQRFGCMVDAQYHNPRRSNNPRHPMPPEEIQALCRQPKPKVNRGEISEPRVITCDHLQANVSNCEQPQANVSNCEQAKTSPLTLSLTLTNTLTDQDPLRAIPGSTEALEEHGALAEMHRYRAVCNDPGHRLSNDIVWDQVKSEHARQFAILCGRKSFDEVRQMLDWAFSDPHWSSIVQKCPAKLDEHWDTISAQRRTRLAGRSRASPSSSRRKCIVTPEEIERRTKK